MSCLQKILISCQDPLERDGDDGHPGAGWGRVRADGPVPHQQGRAAAAAGHSISERRSVPRSSWTLALRTSMCNVLNALHDVAFSQTGAGTEINQLCLLPQHFQLPLSATSFSYPFQLPLSATPFSYLFQLPLSATSFSYPFQLPLSATPFNYPFHLPLSSTPFSCRPFRTI